MNVDPILQAYAVRTATPGERARTMLLQLMGGGAEGDDDGAEQIDGAELIQPMGLFVHPFITPRTEAFGFELGDEVVVLHVLDKSGGGGASPAAFTDTEAGETRLYGAKEAAARIRLRADGSMDIEVKAGVPVRITHPSGARFHILGNGGVDVRSASGQPITLNQGNASVARVGDAVAPSAAMATWLSTVGTATMAGPPPGAFATISAGAPQVKA